MASARRKMMCGFDTAGEIPRLERDTIGTRDLHVQITDDAVFDH